MNLKITTNYQKWMNFSNKSRKILNRFKTIFLVCSLTAIFKVTLLIEQVKQAIIQGLLQSIKQFVIQSKPTDIKSLIEAATSAESTVPKTEHQDALVSAVEALQTEIRQLKIAQVATAQPLQSSNYQRPKYYQHSAQPHRY